MNRGRRGRRHNYQKLTQPLRTLNGTFGTLAMLWRPINECMIIIVIKLYCVSRVWSRWMRSCRRHYPALQVATRGPLVLCGATWCLLHFMTSTTRCLLAVLPCIVACLQRPGLHCLHAQPRCVFNNSLSLLRFHSFIYVIGSLVQKIFFQCR